jgi:hypothetical protein
VGIEGKSVIDMQAFHQGKAGTIGKTKVVICEGFEETPGLFNDFWRDIFNVEKLTSPKCFAKLDRNVMSSSETNNGIAFIQNIIAGDQCLTRLKAVVSEVKCPVMMSISSVLNSQEGRRIYKYHLEDRL